MALLLLLLLLFTVSVLGVNHGPSRMEDLSTRLLLGRRDNWKILRGRLKSLCKAQRFGSHSQMRPGVSWRARTLARRGLAGTERLISLEICRPLWSRSLPLQALAVAVATPSRGYH